MSLSPGRPPPSTSWPRRCWQPPPSFLWKPCWSQGRFYYLPVQPVSATIFTIKCGSRKDLLMETLQLATDNPQLWKLKKCFGCLRCSVHLKCHNIYIQCSRPSGHLHWPWPPRPRWQQTWPPCTTEQRRGWGAGWRAGEVGRGSGSFLPFFPAYHQCPQAPARPIVIYFRYISSRCQGRLAMAVCWNCQLRCCKGFSSFSP